MSSTFSFVASFQFGALVRDAAEQPGLYSPTLPKRSQYSQSLGLPVELELSLGREERCACLHCVSHE